jgi:hypothetical protein
MIFGEQGSIGQPMLGLNRFSVGLGHSAPSFPGLCMNLRENVDRVTGIETFQTLRDLALFSFGDGKSVRV